LSGLMSTSRKKNQSFLFYHLIASTNYLINQMQAKLNVLPFFWHTKFISENNVPFPIGLRKHICSYFQSLNQPVLSLILSCLSNKNESDQLNTIPQHFPRIIYINILTPSNSQV